jgi:hypothetical protein
MPDTKARAIKQMYRTEPRMFFRLAFRLLHPGTEYQQNWSVDVLGEALKRCATGETRRLIINMPPRSLKSICTSVAFPAWLLGTQPDRKIMCIAGHRGLAEDQHDLARRLMTHERYRALFPHVRLDESSGRVTTPHGGCRLALTPSAAITGRGADVVIIDDPQSPSDADDAGAARDVRSWYDRNIYPRLNDKKKGVVIVVMQRLAHDDLTAHLVEQGGWEVLSMPAIAMADERMPESLGGGLARSKGEALHPLREDLQELREALQRMGAKAFMAQYQQEPYAPGAGEGRGGAFHMVRQSPAHGEEYSPVFFTQMPEEMFVLESVFGEPLGVRTGPPPPLTEEAWLARAQSIRRGVPSADRWIRECEIATTSRAKDSGLISPVST